MKVVCLIRPNDVSTTEKRMFVNLHNENSNVMRRNAFKLILKNAHASNNSKCPIDLMIAFQLNKENWGKKTHNCISPNGIELCPNNSNLIACDR